MEPMETQISTVTGVNGEKLGVTPVTESLNWIARQKDGRLLAQLSNLGFAEVTMGTLLLFGLHLAAHLNPVTLIPALTTDILGVVGWSAIFAGFQTSAIATVGGLINRFLPKF